MSERSIFLRQLTLLDWERNRREAILAPIIRASSKRLCPFASFLHRDLLKDCAKHRLGLLLVLHPHEGVDLDVVVTSCELTVHFMTCFVQTQRGN